jgi:hypothetical protein
MHSTAASQENRMLIDTRIARLPLRVGKLARLANACNTRLTCLRGQAWITVDGEARDIVLEAGEQFTIDSNRHVIVHPLRAGAPLELEIDASAPRCKPGRRGGVAGWARALVERLLPRPAPQLAIV